ncbi:hypothetical protein LMG28614_01905 [Paraburkholderia ultramafica]|uniref:Uncharacterized protein n=1 Tax=Paraburkholderia ultramafica TaxID=1544867 RepID=A0A6S7B116_9BURK|nr:hypothetical protein LMG28614_01905 [Paraburkholderia ultramafica]
MNGIMSAISNHAQRTPITSVIRANLPFGFGHWCDRSGTANSTRPVSGYVTEDYVIAHARAAGFELVGKSEVNGNSRDTKNYPNGVWSLPPSYAGGDVDHARYAAIGESDRMTLRFVKPVH